jgi:altronate dehydratase
VRQLSGRCFLGYSRSFGPPGIRNLVLVLSAELSCNPWVTQLVASRAGAGDSPPGVELCGIVHKQGLGNFREDRERFQRVLEGLVRHPNVGAVALVSSGNEGIDTGRLLELAEQSGRPATVLSPLRSGSGSALLQAGGSWLSRSAGMLGGVSRAPHPLQALRVGLNCAGTDLASGRTSNLACGVAMDMVAGGGGTVILSEVPEMIGLGEALYDRCASAEVAEALRAAVQRQERYLSADGADPSENELCPFNVQGGLGSLQEKARISVLKGGSGPILEVTAYGQPPRATGLTVMDGPAMTDFVLTGLLGAGAQLMINCCGGGPANLMPVMVGADSAPTIMPVIKCCGSSRHAASEENRIDMDAGRLLERPELLETVALELVDKILRTASGEHTRTEEGGIFWMNFPLRYHQA